MSEVLYRILRRGFLTLVLSAFLLLVPLPHFQIGPLEGDLPSIKSALVVFGLVILLGKTLYDTLFSRSFP